MGIFHVPLPVGYFSAFSSCLDCCVSSGLSVFWRSVVPFYCGGFTQWVGLDDWLVKVSWLEKLASVFWCMELDFFPLLSKTVGSFSGRLMSSASDQKLFCEVCSALNCSFNEFVGGEGGLPVLVLRQLGSPLLIILFSLTFPKNFTVCTAQSQNWEVRSTFPT